MSSSTGWAGCACRFLRRKIKGDARGFFLVEVLVLSFLVLGCAASAATYRALAGNRAATGAELTAAYLAQEQIARIEAQPASYLRAHTEVPWLGAGSSPVEKNGAQFEIASIALPHAEASGLASVEVRVRWRTGDRSREEIYRKLVTYHD